MQASPSALSARRALWILAVYFIVQIAAAILVFLAFALYEGSLRAVGSRATMPATIAGVMVGGLVSLRMSKHSLREIGWPSASRLYVLSAGLTGVTLSGVYLLIALTLFPPGPHHSLSPFAEAIGRGGWSRHAWALVAVLLAPPVEEFLFRGILFEGLASSWRLSTAGVVTTILFILVHFNGLHPYWPGVLAIAVVATAALHARIATNSLAPCIVIHATYNLGITVAVYANGVA
jgi:membrane protease YdiL (CAAX protease family)